jgi:hypothetical protein
MNPRNKFYCQIYCQKRGGEGITGDGEPRVFSNLLISICVYVGSTNRESDLNVAVQRQRSGAKRRTSGAAASNPTLSTK